MSGSKRRPPPAGRHPRGARQRSRPTAKHLLLAVVALGVGSGLVGPGCARREADKWLAARPATHRAGGTVLVDGTPQAGVKVQFEQAAGPNGRMVVAFGLTDARGRFRLRTFRDGDGAVAGEHAVLIERVTFEALPAAPGDELPGSREVSHLPERYRSAPTSGLSATVVPGGRNDFSFRITSQ